jgi:lipoprotein NlpD
MQDDELMRLSLKLRWLGALWGALLVAGGALSGCATDSAPGASAFTTHCRTVLAGYYCVQPGDSLDSVAQGFGRKPLDVARWNGLAPGAPLLVGQMLRMAPPDWSAWHADAPRTAARTRSETAHAAPTAASGQFVWPASGVVVREFGADGSRGIEIASRVGAPIKAAADGRVVYAGNGIKPYGLMVIIKHDGGFVTAYGNNRKLLVHEGDTVQRGTVIAEMGTQSDGEPLLQFEMREGSRAVDPLAHLPAGSGPIEQ